MNDLGLCALLIGYVAGDFYLRSDAIADKKIEDFKYVLIHAGLYTLTMAAVLLAAFRPSGALFYIWAAVSSAYFVIESAGFLIVSRGKTRMAEHIKKRGTIIFLATHFLAIIILWHFLGVDAQIRVPVFFIGDVFPKDPAVIMLGILICVKPAGQIIGKGEIWDLSSRIGIVPDTSRKKAGQMIGYLERVIILFFVVYGQFGSIAFVITAKSVARFKEIENDRSLAEYYLIGTLLSVSLAMAAAFMLGLCPVA